MPGKDGTGPVGQGSGFGGGQGPGGGRGRQGGNRPGSGPGGNCVCPSCGTIVAHQRGIPCYQTVCPKCGVKMVKQ